ncbi:NAD(P)/FAD-dependent oxidoreductase [Shewanella woodyi]|uniref:2-hydroxyglutarate dehydrogenase n=1 Tax=Shewanella woodyi (strain ATCC 51908 / MS32) TaxID=392500 RepID=B1KDC8_SHEWM|nr:NAD(P)/FAD-dependent oxidoreductase [Shewanella woodyi]ACA84929.1 2-hydroxyglutarate dehydrogenase [Shewanella woodyi ATCC 51908]
MEKLDVIVVGAGVVGLAIAAKLIGTSKSLAVIDRRGSFGEETSSRNSEVIHAGIYYPQHSLKAKLCVAGKHALYEYCQQKGVPFSSIGKLIIANNSAQEGALHAVMAQALNNGVDDLCWVSKQGLDSFSPQLSACAALLSPSTGIIDSHSYMSSLLADIELGGGIFASNTELVRAEPISDGFIVWLNVGGDVVKMQCRHLINSCGLSCTEVAKRIEGLDVSLLPELYWCKGHYFNYSGVNPFTKLIYPAPEQNSAGLGIHATIDMAGQLRFGPDAHYLSPHDLFKSQDYSIPLSLKESFITAIKRYYPSIDAAKLHPGCAGIRPKLQGPNDSFKDFHIQGAGEHHIDGLINLFGIESPGLTASLALAEYVANMVKESE